MTDEKKNGETTEPVEEKKDKIEDNGKEKVTDKKTIAKEIKKEKKVAKEPEQKDLKEEAKPDAPEEKVETKLAEENTEEIKAEEEVPEGKERFKKSLGNLNFYPELRTDLPEIKPGDALKIFYRVVEGGKERIQLFEGTVIAMKNSGIAKTITVRKTSFGISIERIFPLNSKLVQKIEVIKHSRVRRAKLYYLRKLKGKAARLKELR